MSVTLISRNGCVRCDVATRLWARHGVEVEVVDVDRHPALVAALLAAGMSQLPVQVVRDDGCSWAGWLGRTAGVFLDTAVSVWAGLDPERVRAWAQRGSGLPAGGGGR